MEETVSRLLQDNHKKEGTESEAREEFHGLNTRNMKHGNKTYIQCTYKLICRRFLLTIAAM